VAGTADNFTIEVLDATLPVCVEFYATWCTQCAYFYPGLMNFAADEAGHVKVVRIDGDLYPGLCSTYGVTGYPTTIFFKNGVEANRFAGGTHVAATDEAILINIFNNI
jgi:thioredoxin 1